MDRTILSGSYFSVEKQLAWGTWKTLWTSALFKSALDTFDTLQKRFPYNNYRMRYHDGNPVSVPVDITGPVSGKVVMHRKSV